MHTSSRVCCALAVALAATAFASAIDNPPPAPQRTAATFGEEVQVTVVNVDVYVRDREGRPVHGLTAGDFHLTQDGVEVPISNFAAFGDGKGSSSLAAEANDPGVALLSLEAPSAPGQRPISVVLYVDNVNLRLLDRNRVLDRLRDFVAETLRPPVEMMVAVSRPSLAVRQPFTDDATAIQSALERIAEEGSGWLARDHDRREILDWMERIDGDVRRDAQEFRNWPQNAVMELQVRAMIDSYAAQEADILEDSLCTLHEVVRLAGSRKGRGVVIHVSNGLPLMPAVDLLHEYEAVFQDSTIYARIARHDFSNHYRALVEAANARGVSLYAVDASGLAPLEGFDAADRWVPAARASGVRMRDLQDSLGFLADGTGGLAVLNTNDVSAGLERIRDDLGSYYSLGFAITPSGRDERHRIEVELPGHPEPRVRHRQWFVEKSPLTRMRERVLTTLIRDPGHNSMDVVLSALDATSEPDRRRRDLQLKVSIPLASLTLRAEGSSRVGELQLVVGLRDATGRESAPQAVTHELRIPAARIAPAAAGQRVAVILPLRIRGRLQHMVAVGVRDLESGETSYARLLVRKP